MIWVKALAVWLAILVVAVLNGAMRERVLAPRFGIRNGQIASGVLLTSAIFAASLAAAPWYGSLSSTGYWAIGLGWVLLTLVFEFGFGRLVQKRPWRDLLTAYTFKDGNIWPVVLAATLVSPWVAAGLRGLL
jgi:hypothetical protein